MAMAHPWYSFYPADYQRRTSDLTMVQDGAYRRLMDQYYLTGEPLPAIADSLLRICRAFADDEKAAVTYVLHRYFVEGDDGWHHTRIDEEIVKRADLSQKRAAAGGKGASKTNGKRPANAQQPERQLPTHSQSHTQKKEDTRASRFDDFWNVCPKKSGKGTAEKAFSKATSTVDPDILIAAMARYGTSQAGKDQTFTKTPGPWLNGKHWLDEGIAPAAPPTAEADEAARGAWGGEAAPLVAEIGAASFQAYFGTAEFDPGPPAHIRVAKSHIRDLIARKYPAQLKRAFGEVILEVSA